MKTSKSSKKREMGKRMKKWLLLVLTFLLTAAIIGCAAGTGESGNADANHGASTGSQPDSGNGTGENANSGDETGTGGESSTLEAAREAGVVMVGFANEKPYAYEDQNGNLTGFSVEIARNVLQKLGIERMEGELVDFGQLITGLNAGRYDMITAGMYINPERCAQVLFAEPEYRMGEALAVIKGNPKNLHSYENVAETGAKIAVMAGAIEIDLLTAAGVSKEQILEVKDQPAAVSALQTGQVDGITMTAAALISMLESARDDNLERVMDFEQPKVDGEEQWGYGAAVFRKDDTAFRDAFNAELQKVKESSEWNTIAESFGFTENEHPGDVTAAALCAAP